MDTSQFDALTRWFSTSSSRRGTLGLAFGALSALLGVAETEAQRCKKRCGRCKTCNRKTGRCRPDPDGTACGDGKVCCKGRCRACCRDRDCDAGEICAAGQCVVGQGNCPAGSSDCQVDNKCNDNSACKCHQRLEGGTRCVQFNDVGACDQCETDADCLALGFSPGSSCIRDDGPECFCNADAKGFCGEPCGFVAATTVTRSGAKGPRR